MKKISKAGVSIIEAIVLILIISFAVIGVYKLYNESSKLSESSKNRIQAIQIAREGIEAVTNIRDTNWLLLGADPNNCWNTINYNHLCIGKSLAPQNYEILPGNYRVYKKENDHKWYLNSVSFITGYANDFSDNNYRNNFLVFLDNDGFYNQKGNGIINNTQWKSGDFTREIKIEYLDEVSVHPKTKMKVTSIVQWHDGLLGTSRKIELSQILTNWQKKNN